MKVEFEFGNIVIIYDEDGILIAEMDESRTNEPATTVQIDKLKMHNLFESIEVIRKLAGY